MIKKYCFSCLKINDTAYLYGIKKLNNYCRECVNDFTLKERTKNASKNIIRMLTGEIDD